MLGQGLAACAGVCAAMASVCAKLAMASPATLGLCRASRQVLVQYAQSNDMQFLETINLWIPHCSAVITYIRISFFGLIFLFNALMWTLFTKSMQKCSTTVEATVINTATNLLSTAAIGHILFGEALSIMWLAGASLILIGLAFIHTESSSEEQEKKDN